MPIEDVRLGQRVFGENPKIEDEPEATAEPDEATWREVHFQMTKLDGGQLNVQLLRSLEWIEEHGAKVGATVELDLAELGADGPAEVTYVGPCPPIQQGEGHCHRALQNRPPVGTSKPTAMWMSRLM